MTTTGKELAKKELSPAERRARLERRANVIRSRLFRTIDALDHRRHQVAEVTHHVKRLAKPVAVTAFGVAAACVALGIGVTALVRHRREKRLSYQVSQFLDRFRVEKRPSILEDVLRKAAVSVTTIVAAELAKRGARNLLDGRSPLDRALPAAK